MSLKDDVEAILKETPLYCGILNVPGFQHIPSQDAYFIGPTKNHPQQPSTKFGGGFVAIPVSRDAVEIYLKDVLIDQKQPKPDGRSFYEFELTNLTEDSAGIKIEGKLGKPFEFGLGQDGTNYSGKTIAGYVEKIWREKDRPKIKISDDFPF